GYLALAGCIVLPEAVVFREDGGLDCDVLRFPDLFELVFLFLHIQADGALSVGSRAGCRAAGGDSRVMQRSECVAEGDFDLLGGEKGYSAGSHFRFRHSVFDVGRAVDMAQKLGKAGTGALRRLPTGKLRLRVVIERVAL